MSVDSFIEYERRNFRKKKLANLNDYPFLIELPIPHKKVFFETKNALIYMPSYKQLSNSS